MRPGNVRMPPCRLRPSATIFRRIGLFGRFGVHTKPDAHRSGTALHQSSERFNALACKCRNRTASREDGGQQPTDRGRIKPFPLQVQFSSSRQLALWRF
jgi:hypothetical protein